MLRTPLRWAFRRLGRRYPRVAMAMQFQLAHFVVAGGVGLLRLYVEMSTADFVRIMVVSQVLVVFENLAAYWVASRLVRPADPWLRGDRSPQAAIEAWRALAGLPLNFLRYRRFLPLIANTVPIAIYVTVELEEEFFPWFLVLAAGAGIVLLYGVFLRFFALELIMRPVLEQISGDIPDGTELGKATLPLRWRLLVALPAINIISGVTIVGFAAPESGLDTLGLGILVTFAVAFTISLELSVLVLRSIAEPLRDIRDGTRRVAQGDFTTRVPVLGSDEAGEVAGSFNQMVAGLEERERLREAFGAYVDPELADRVLAEGAMLEGDEAEVSILFLDIRDFTSFAERASAREVVTRLNEFYELVVPIVSRYGGHANKFVGDGLLAVFGAPERLGDHADRAVAAGCETARQVRDRYGDELRIGIGVNSGQVVAGSVGGGGRIDFTVIGDAVNTAARVEELTRETGDTILITDATRCLLRHDHGGFVERGTVELKGKSEPVLVYAPAETAAVKRGQTRFTGAVSSPPA